MMKEIVFHFTHLNHSRISYDFRTCSLPVLIVKPLRGPSTTVSISTEPDLIQTNKNPEKDAEKGAELDGKIR